MRIPSQRFRPHRTHSFGLPFIVLVLISCCAGMGRAGVPQAGSVPACAVPIVQSRPDLDGRLDDECWQEAYVSTAFYRSGTSTPADRPEQGTTLYLGRAGTSLLVGFDCRTPIALSGPDSVTVFLDPTHCHEYSYNYVVSSTGETKLETWADPEWTKRADNWQAAVAQTDGGWSAELSIDLMRLPHLRAHTSTIGLLVARIEGEDTRLVWALNDTRQGLMGPDAGIESFWACHVRGLDVPGLIAAIDAENAVSFAPLAPRVEALRESTIALLRDEKRPVETRLKALSLAVWLEDLDPKRRQYVERVSLRGLAEREQYLRDAEALAAMLADGKAPPLDLSSALAPLAANPQGPAQWEINTARPIGRFQGRSDSLGVSFAGLAFASIFEQHWPDAESAAARLKDRDRNAAEGGFTVQRRTQGSFDVLLRQRPPNGPEELVGASRGLDLYDFSSAVPGGKELLAAALTTGTPLDASVLDRLLGTLPQPAAVGNVQAVLAFPLAQATLVMPGAGGLRAEERLKEIIGAAAVSPALPDAGAAVVTGTTGHAGALQAAGFDTAAWAGAASSARVEVHEQSGRAVLGLWGREDADLEHAARLMRNLRDLLTGRTLLVGDLHAHSVLSDGSGSPRQVVLEAMASGLDFAAVTDHSMVEGSLQAKAWCDQLHLPFTVIRGEEVLGRDFEIVALGIGSWVSPQPDPKKISAAIHQQGGMALLCHPWGAANEKIVAQLDSLGVDGIDRHTDLTAAYLAEKERLGRQPVVTEVTDAHELAFAVPERTLVFAQDRSEQGILKAIREGYYVTLSARGFEGAPDLVEVVLTLVGERSYLLQQYRTRAEARVKAAAAALRAGGL